MSQIPQLLICHGYVRYLPLLMLANVLATFLYKNLLHSSVQPKFLRATVFRPEIPLQDY